MKLVLHIGMPKAGSSALQNSLRAAKKQLRRHGLLYPAGGGLPKNHNMLVCGFVEPPRLPRLFRQVYAGDEGRVKRDFDGFMQALEDAVHERCPDTLVLSGEMLWSCKLGPRKADALRAALSRLADDMTIVAYVRSPAQFYASLVQQALKASSRISIPRRVPYRRALESYARIAQDIRVVAYERSRLYGGDITRDFLHRLAPSLADSLKTKTMKQSNQTISAEGMDILHRYRSRNHAGSDGIFTKDTGALIKTIEALEERVGTFRRPSPRDRVRDYINGASSDLLWLRERHGIVFSDVDYERISDELPPPAPPRTVAEICDVDGERRDRMLMAILGHLTNEPATAGVPAEPFDDEQRDRMLIAIRDHLMRGPGMEGAVRFKTAVANAEP